MKPPPGNTLKRTFPSKKKASIKGKAATRAPKGMNVSVRKRGSIGVKKKIGNVKAVDKKKVIGKKIDEFISLKLEIGGIQYTEDMKNMVYRKCYLLLHGIAKLHNQELIWTDEYRDSFFFSHVQLPYLNVVINSSRAESEIDSRLIASYAFFKFLLATRGMLDDRAQFIPLLLKSTVSELAQIAVHVNELLLAFSAAFGSSVSVARGVEDTRKRQIFGQVRAAVILHFQKIANEMSSRQIPNLTEKDLRSSLSELYCEVDKNRVEKKGTRKVFESSDEEEDEEMSTLTSTARGVDVNSEERGRSKSDKIIKQEVDEEVITLVEVKKEIKSEDEEENSMNGKKSRSVSVNGWESDVDEDETSYCHPSTYASTSTGDEFHSNLVDIARDTWSKSVALYSIQNEPSVKERFKMAQFIIECLEEKYGDELLEILQFFTFQSFEPNFSSIEEAIGLLLYLDQKLLIGDSFFFLLMAMNDKDNARVALDESEECCRAQLKAAKIGRSVMLGKPLQLELLAANKEATAVRKGLQMSKYHLFFPGIIAKNVMKKITYVRQQEERELSRESRLKSSFVEEFWTTASKMFNVSSEWSTYEVNQSAVRVLNKMNEMFKDSLIPLVRTINGRGMGKDSAISDPRSGHALIALYRMRNVGFFTDSLLYSLLRFDDANVMKKCTNKLSKLCDGFKKVVEAVSKSKAHKADEELQAIKDHFSERSVKVNADCLQLFEGLMKTEARKQHHSVSSTTVDMEPRRKRKREMDDNDNKNREGDRKKKKMIHDGDGGEEKIKEESIEEEKKKVPKEEIIDEKEDECMIIEVKKKKVKVEEISDDEEEMEKMRKEKKRKRERRESKRSTNGDEEEVNEKQRSTITTANIVIKEEAVEDMKSEGRSTTDSKSVDDRERFMEDDDEGETKTDQAGYPNLNKVREMLIGQSKYWEDGLKTWNVVSVPSVDNRYKVAKKILLFLEDSFGDEIRKILFFRTRVQFAPSDLNGKEEVIGLVLYLDHQRLSISYFFFFLLALNDESKVDNILASCKDSLGVHLKHLETCRRFMQREADGSERKRAKKAVTIDRKKLKKKLPYFFGDICKSYDTEGDQLVEYGMNNKLENMKNTPFTDTYWEKYEKKFGTKSELSVFDVCYGSARVLTQLDKLFHGSLISNWSNIFRSNPLDDLSYFTRTAFNGMMCLNKIKIFPDGLIFLLVMNSKNEQVLEEACSLLKDLVRPYLDFFRDFAPNFNYNARESTIRDRSNAMKRHESGRKCIKFLLDSLKRDNSCTTVIASRPVTQLVPSRESIPSSDESVWRYNCKWKVTTFWSQSDEWKEWEKNHSSDMDRLTDRMNSFMNLAAMREEHYEKKEKVADWLRSVLKTEMEKTQSTMEIVGSSPCLVGAANSNLDLFIKNSQKHTDLPAFMDILKREKGILIRPFKKRSIHMIVNTELTSGQDLFVSIHIAPSTAYMSRVYQIIDGQDDRVSALSLVLKAWNIVDPSCVTGKVQSYHVMVMLIHFLQCGVNPPVLPSLTHLYPNADPTLYHSLDLPAPIPQENKQSLASLLFGFFNYFSLFEFDEYIISIREGYLFKRSVVGEGPSRERMMMEHPFDNCLKEANSVYVFTEVEYGHIRSACKRAHESLIASFNVPFLSVL